MFFLRECTILCHERSGVWGWPGPHSAWQRNFGQHRGDRNTPCCAHPKTKHHQATQTIYEGSNSASSVTRSTPGITASTAPAPVPKRRPATSMLINTGLSPLCTRRRCQPIEVFLVLGRFPSVMNFYSPAAWSRCFGWLAFSMAVLSK